MPGDLYCTTQRNVLCGLLSSGAREERHQVRPDGLEPRGSSTAPNNSLQLTRLACGRLERDLPARMRENETTVA